MEFHTVRMSSSTFSFADLNDPIFFNPRSSCSCSGSILVDDYAKYSRQPETKNSICSYPLNQSRFAGTQGCEKVLALKKLRATERLPELLAECTQTAIATFWISSVTRTAAATCRP